MKGVPRESDGGFAARLLAWFDERRRDLPWRRTRDGWAIWVSEIMLQQTRVEAVREPWRRFVERYPEPAAFAHVDDDELHQAWRGLGYYRRARLLREGARAVVERHGGKLPADPGALAELPGIGAYTAGALGSIVFGRAEPAIDGNVLRVVARHRAIETPIDSALAMAAVREAVLRRIDAARPGDFNQALMELGATVCTPVAHCQHCPVAADCAARRDGRTHELPRQKPRRKPTVVEARVVLCTVRGGVLGHRVPPGEPNPGQVELPGPGVLRSIEPADLAAQLRQRFGAEIEIGPAVATAAHAITHHRIRVVAHAARVRRRGRLEPFAVDDDAIPWTTVSRKLFRALAGEAPSPGPQRSFDPPAPLGPQGDRPASQRPPAPQGPLGSPRPRASRGPAARDAGGGAR